MSYRILRPHGNAGDSSASASGPPISTPESSESNPGAASSFEKTTDEVETSSSIKQVKRRKVPETVTRNACSHCKKARSKCDGESPCSRCVTRGEADCVYEIHIKHAKEEMVQQIKELTAYQQMTEKVFTTIASRSEQTPNIVKWLQEGESLAKIVQYLSSTTQGHPIISMVDARSPAYSSYSAADIQDNEAGLSAKGLPWTTITSDQRVFRHLFSLYFSWVHPIHTIFNEGIFVKSYHAHSEKHCSQVLVNAICAMACQMHTKQDKGHVDYERLGLLFMEAARSLVRPEMEDLTTAQALAVMFLVDYSRGKGHRASTYLKIATRTISRMNLPLQDGCLENCSKDTLCGIQNLNIEWAQMTFQAPIISLNVRFEWLGQDLIARDNSHWYYYRYETDQPPAWPCLLATTTLERAKLTSIIRHMTELYHGYQETSISATQLLGLHKKYTNWKAQLSTSLGDVENNTQALPHVLTMLILFHAAVTQLLRPILSLNDLPRVTMVAIEEEVWRHAQMGLYLLERHYRTHWTCRYQPTQQLFSVLHLTDVVARFFPKRTDPSSKNGPEAVQLAMDVFGDSRPGLAISGQFQAVLFRVASGYSFDVPERSVLPPTEFISTSMDDTIEACGNPSFLPPLNDILRRYQPNFCRDWIAESPSYGFKETPGAPRRREPLDSTELGAEHLMRIRNLLNT